MNRGASLTNGELDLIASTYRMSAHFQRMRHTRRCPRCRCYLAVDNAGRICSPCEIAESRERNGSRP
jgi:hypothetical protein